MQSGSVDQTKDLIDRGPCGPRTLLDLMDLTQIRPGYLDKLPQNWILVMLLLVLLTSFLQQIAILLEECCAGAVDRLQEAQVHRHQLWWALVVARL